ncbi:MAG: hypothetical protein GW946_04220 [Candidatus Pacebacteria bacterium]|nr:hypothetical protein [Candidatus Paceibacterota bacterium]
MKVFYTTSLRGVDGYRPILESIYKIIEDLGHTNLDKVLFNIPDKDGFYKGSHSEKVDHFKRMMTCIKDADVIVLEVSTHSLSMGYLLQKALEIGKPVIALHLSGRDPFFLQGIENEKLQIIEYKEDELEQALSASLDYAQGMSDVRFNFFISPSIGAYLDWISKKKKIPRSVFLRSLIQKQMEADSEYLKN